MDLQDSYRVTRLNSTYSVRVTVEVVNQNGDVMIDLTTASFLNTNGRLVKTFTLADGAVGIHAAMHDFGVICDRVEAA